MESKHQLRPGPVIFIYYWGAKGRGRYHMSMSYWRAIMIPQKATLDSMSTLSWFVSFWRLSSQLQFSLSAVTLVYLSQWLRSQCNVFGTMCLTQTKNEAFWNFSPDPTRGSRTPESWGLILCFFSALCENWSYIFNCSVWLVVGNRVQQQVAVSTAAIRITLS
jgi:hypothetical protein